jgi:hypothetical protein
MTASDDMETHTSSFAFIFFCFFDFRLSTFTHCASGGSPSGGISSESKVFSFFEGADEDEEGRFMAVAFWELLIGSHVPATHRYVGYMRTFWSCTDWTDICSVISGQGIRWYCDWHYSSLQKL